MEIRFSRGVDFWKDNWADTDMPRINYTVSLTEHFEATKVVENYVDSEERWDQSSLINT